MSVYARKEVLFLPNLWCFQLVHGERWDSCALGHAESDLWASLFLLFFFVVGGIFKDTQVVLEQHAVPCDPVRRGGSRMVRTKL